MKMQDKRPWINVKYLDGSHCRKCKQYIGSVIGSARLCLECQRDEDEEIHQPITEDIR